MHPRGGYLDGGRGEVNDKPKMILLTFKPEFPSRTSHRRIGLDKVGRPTDRRKWYHIRLTFGSRCPFYPWC